MKRKIVPSTTLSKSGILIALTTIAIIVATLLLTKNFIYPSPDFANSKTPSNQNNTSNYSGIETGIKRPKEKWTPQEKKPEKLQGIAVGKNNTVNIGEKGTFFTRSTHVKDNTYEILSLLGYKKEENESGQTIKTDSNGGQLSPIIALYSNWDENPSSPPNAVNFQGKQSILLNPASNQTNKTPNQTLSDVYLIYQIPKSLKDNEILIEVQCRQIDTEKTKQANQKTKEDSTKSGPTEEKNERKKSPSKAPESDPPQITARFLNHNFYFKNPFSPENKRLPRSMATLRFERKLSSTDNFLMLRASTSGDQSIVLVPTISVSEIKKVTNKEKTDTQKR